MVNLKRDSLSKQVADKLENLIKDGKYKIGDKIPTESELMTAFGVSRNTIRESIQSLNSVGILSVRQGDGTYVTASDRFSASMIKKYDTGTLQDIKETRNTIEISLALLASERRTDEDLANIKLALEKRTQCNESSKEHTVADIEFHMAIAKASHNKILYDLYYSLYSYLIDHIKIRSMSTKLKEEKIDELHQKLYEAIEQGDRVATRHYVVAILEI